MELWRRTIDIIFHVDAYLEIIISQFGNWSYLILFAVIFSETGLVITPFLPGDSLLFAAGSFAAQGFFNIFCLALIIAAAAVIGDFVNYHIGFFIGPRVFHRERSRFFKKEYLDRTHAFYQKHGAKTIILARFVPVVRTFAPFVAGVGAMGYWRFAAYNIVGAVLWTGIFVGGGYFFGNLSFVKDNFSLFILAIIFASFLPGIISYFRRRVSFKKQNPA